MPETAVASRASITIAFSIAKPEAALCLVQMTDPYLNLYRGLVPPLLGTIDFTPLLGFFILQYISGVLESGAAEDELDEWW